MADQREEVMRYIRTNGPCLPVQIAKLLNINILFASAVLSELVSRKQLHFSHAAIGGSKLYYIPGQENLLLERLSRVYKGKEREAYDLLKAQRVLRDKDLEPWQRVAFRSLHDTASAITVTVSGMNELFWKYKLTSDADVEALIKTILDAEQPEPAPIAAPQPQTITQNAPTTQTIIEPTPAPLPPPVQTPIAQPAFQQETFQQAMADLKEELLKEFKPRIEETKTETPIPPTIAPEPEKPKKKPAIVKEPVKSEGLFYGRVLNYLKTNNIEVIKEEMIKKEKEFDFLVKIPSSIGPLMYYLKAKDKKAVNEAEISIVYSEGQLKKLPTIFLTNGTLNKKAETFIEQKLQGQLHVKELE